MKVMEVVLCIGMHRSGTSLTASLLKSLGVCLPGDLIEADTSNKSGYFENRSIVTAQEQLLKELGYWWPTELASRGMPASVEKQKVYREYINWLSNHLEEVLIGSNNQIAVKDPRTSLLLPAWIETSRRLGIKLRAVICVREPRDVCWSLVRRDGPSVGMTWSRAQRLWMQHYKQLLNNLGRTPAFIVSYENWLETHTARAQLDDLARFIGHSYQHEQKQDALARIKPEFNHGRNQKLPPVDSSIKRLHAYLTKPKVDVSRLGSHACKYSLKLEQNLRIKSIVERININWIQTPWGRRYLGSALDKKLYLNNLVQQVYVHTGVSF